MDDGGQEEDTYEGEDEEGEALRIGRE